MGHLFAQKKFQIKFRRQWRNVIQERSQIVRRTCMKKLASLESELKKRLDVHEAVVLLTSYLPRVTSLSPCRGSS